MKLVLNLLIVFCLAILPACGNSQDDSIPSEAKILTGDLYANALGEIRLIQKSDSTMRTIFKNNDGHVFDTVMKIVPDFNLIQNQDSLPFLQFKTGGIEWHKEYIWVHEFSGLAQLGLIVQIGRLYDEPFYRIGTQISLDGDLNCIKGGCQLKGIHLEGYRGGPFKYMRVEGRVQKEKYPIEYYSTPESPQGMFSDTSIAHYRLIMEAYKTIEIPKRKMRGNTMNIEGKAAFIWEFADSEAYYIANQEPWSTKESNQTIVLEAVLVQFIEGKSVLKNCVILEWE